MLDLSPEKLMVLLVVAVVILGPHRLPATARTLARGLVRARRLADSLTQPVHDTMQEPRRILNDTMQEPRRILNDAIADLRTTVQPLPSTAPTPAANPVDLPTDPDLN